MTFAHVYNKELSSYPVKED